METVILGISASIISEITSVFKKWLTNTPFEGSAAQIVVMIISVLGALIDLTWTHQISSLSWPTIGKTAAEIWALAEIYYMAIGQWYSVHSNPKPAINNPLNN